MNIWTKLSIEQASQKDYLDKLFDVYPVIPETTRVINTFFWKEVEVAFKNKDNFALIESLLKMDLFPIKDSYVAYFKRDRESLRRNPQTVARIAERLYSMGLETIFARCSEPKEANRQMGQHFGRWVKKGSLGVKALKLDEFLKTKENAVLAESDAVKMSFAKEYLNYQHGKGLDLVARFNGKYVIGEAKFLTDFGGHQNAQFNDAISTITSKGVNAIKVAILDGVVYVKGRNSMYRKITTEYKDENIMSSLVLKDFLNQI
jgi:hypothetical protein